jgi:mRNA-degrading endonuclease RelE of RelBE toxin-antitoxin system
MMLATPRVRRSFIGSIIECFIILLANYIYLSLMCPSVEFTKAVKKQVRKLGKGEPELPQRIGDIVKRFEEDPRDPTLNVKKMTDEPILRLSFRHRGKDYRVLLKEQDDDRYVTLNAGTRENIGY